MLYHIDSAEKWYRIIPSQYPPIDLFEAYYDTAEEMELAYYLEMMTSKRSRQESGQLMIVPKSDWIWGAGSTPIMAAFTDTGKPSRFTDGSYGIYYASENVATAITESMHAWTQFLSFTDQASGEFTFRCYVNSVKKPLVDITGDEFEHLRQPSSDTYPVCRQFAKKHKEEGAYGLLYLSARKQGTRCIAVLRPPALTPSVQGSHFKYYWDNSKSAITRYERLTIDG